MYRSPTQFLKGCTMKSLIVFYSYHHNNTQKVAEAMAKALNAKIKPAQHTHPQKPQKYDLVGFGSGIYDGKHHETLLALADKLPQVTNKKAFIFSTSGMTGEKKLTKDHSTLREKLQHKGYEIVDEFNCAGLNTNKFFKLVGGLNKNRPNVEDLKLAEEFAYNLVK